MKFSDEMLIAYIDNEIDAANRAAIEAALASDRELAARIDTHRAISASLHKTYAPVLGEAVPNRLAALAARFEEEVPTAKVIDFAARNGNGNGRNRIDAPKPRAAWPWLGGMAASLVLGVLIGHIALAPETASMIKTESGRLVAAGSLADALSRQLSPGQSPDAAVKIAVSFRAKNGEYCRAFNVRSASEMAGVACHSGDAWRIRMVAGDKNETSGASYRQAGSALPTGVLQTVDELIMGEAFDAPAEAAAAAKGWR